MANDWPVPLSFCCQLQSALCRFGIRWGGRSGGGLNRAFKHVGHEVPHYNNGGRARLKRRQTSSKYVVCSRTAGYQWQSRALSGAGKVELTQVQSAFCGVPGQVSFSRSCCWKPQMTRLELAGCLWSWFRGEFRGDGGEQVQSGKRVFSQPQGSHTDLETCGQLWG